MSLWESLAQQAISMAVARSTSRLSTSVVTVVGVIVLGLLASIILASAACVAGVVVLALWLWPQSSNPAAIAGIITGALAILAIVAWLVATHGRAVGDVLSESLNPPSPIDKLDTSLHHIVEAFRRGWNTPS